jgi:hypothetical protein
VLYPTWEVVPCDGKIYEFKVNGETYEFTGNLDRYVGEGVEIGTKFHDAMISFIKKHEPFELVVQKDIIYPEGYIFSESEPAGHVTHSRMRHISGPLSVPPNIIHCRDKFTFTMDDGNVVTTDSGLSRHPVHNRFTPKENGMIILSESKSKTEIRLYKNKINIEYPIPGEGKDIMLIDLYRGPNVDTSTFMNGHMPTQLTLQQLLSLWE